MNRLSFPAPQRRRVGLPVFFYFCLASIIASLPADQLWADPGYSVHGGTVAFTVGTNVPYLKVSGSTSAVKGGGEATVASNTATVRNLRFELDPKTFQTGMKLRDKHLYEKVFTASDNSIPRVVLRADRFEATLNPKNSRWEGTLQAQLTMRGVTRPVSFRASLDKTGAGAVVAAHGSVKTSDFGVKRIAYSGATVNDEVTVSVSNLRVEP